MRVTKNLMLQKLESGKNVYGTCITSTGPMWPRAIVSAGLDFVFIDTEHIPLDRNELALLCQFFASNQVVPIVRIPSPDPFRACQTIDGGATGIVVPYIESVEQVKAMIGAVKYRPLKGELLDSYIKGNLEMPKDLKSYIESFNNENICIANIESMPAMERLEDILCIPGLDGVFIGPHDLSVSMGIPEQYDHPEFEKAVRKIIQSTRAKGLHIGIHFSLEPERQIQWIKEGANIIVHSFDIALFLQRLKQDMQIIKSAVGDANTGAASSNLIV